MKSRSENFFNTVVNVDCSNHTKKKELQKLLLIREIMAAGYATCTELSIALGMSYPNSSDLLKDLVARNFLSCCKAGRNKVYSLIPEFSTFFLHIEIEKHKYTGRILDQLNNLKEEVVINEDFFISENTEQCLKYACTAIIKTLKTDTNDILGICFILPPYQTFVHFPSPEIIKRIEINLAITYDKFVKITNSSSCIHRGIFEKNKKVLNNALIINVDQEIGLSIISNGKIRNKSHFFGSEFGHISIQQNHKICSCGKTDCLESLISYEAVKNKIKNAITNGRTSLININNCTISTIVQKALTGDQLCKEIITETGIILGKAISYLIKLTDPDKLIILSDFTATKSIFSTSISTSLQLYCPIQKINSLKMQFSHFRMEPLISGSIFLIWDKIIDELNFQQS